IVPEFCKNLGIAFQIINDLKDWQADSDNKLVAGQDVLAARPTLLLALAFEGVGAADREDLSALLERASQAKAQPSDFVEQVRALFQHAGVFEKAEKLIDKFRARAEAVADDVEPTELRELLYFLVDTVLDLPSAAAPESEPQVLVQLA